MGELYDRILLPTDGSAGMHRVIEHGSDLARIHDATLHALYVIDAGSFANLPMETSPESVRSLLQDEGENALQEVRTLVDEDVPLETTIRDGSPNREIVDYATQTSCDVIVMGTHGRSGINRVLLGSVAERVVRRSPIPVLTVNVSDDQLAAGSEE